MSFITKNITCAVKYTIRSFSQETTFHKRPLPETLIALSSPAGKQIFREALEMRGMESYFPLSEQFVTQSEPSFCSISSLVMVLNALKYDPKKIWKGPWRWVSEETLQCESTQICGHSLDKIHKYGMNFLEFESLAKCHGVNIKSIPVFENRTTCSSSAARIENFRDHLENISSNEQAHEFLIVNFSRKYLNQTGGGHFSPIGGYHKGKDLVLVLDVARFKYPPYWVPITDLWAAMSAFDEMTNQCRGYYIISNNINPEQNIPTTTLTDGIINNCLKCDSHKMRNIN